MTVLLTGAAERLAAPRAGDGQTDPSDVFVGEGFTSPGFGMDEVAARAH